MSGGVMFYPKKKKPYRYLCPFCNKTLTKEKQPIMFEELKCQSCLKIIDKCDMTRWHVWE